MTRDSALILSPRYASLARSGGFITTSGNLGRSLYPFSAVADECASWRTVIKRSGRHTESSVPVLTRPEVNAPKRRIDFGKYLDHSVCRKSYFTLFGHAAQSEAKLFAYAYD